ncbi:aliphatic sulfonate ABC transporter ATP-binding protein [Sinorhizobium glycinis]|uniref:Aliphatic sulfonate ABC transporter ATP-binding protein n=1 Tax=Sinorhizobium glycinis TaxID=1472378 RepID=A0A178Y6N2_9HYPH|nr:ATP-binding cassette domain-containing protein [Sinorhizobium glycinis]OAP42994.1 aliphatic sulfonate ABC transporter ATP-binding protein [Sinorhizobium glycinis]
MSGYVSRYAPRPGTIEPLGGQRQTVSAGATEAVSIELRRIDQTFGPNRVLRGIDLDVPAGQFLAIVGKSGCGKSTLLRLLVGLDRPTSGSLRFADRSGDTVEANARIVFQEPRLLPWARVVDNVAVGLGQDVDENTAHVKALMVLDEVQLLDKADQWPARLSGGQRQRVALARALVSRPGLLVFDEPLGALDALKRITMQQLVSRVWRELGFTAILVTHDVSEAVHLADRVIVLDGGKVALDLDIAAEHPRHHGDPDLAVFERRLLNAILGAD